jgi:hypothetical protein
MIHFQLLLKRVLFFCSIFILSFHLCEGANEQEYFESEYEARLQLENSSISNWETGVEALIFKTNVINADHFEVSGYIGLKADAQGVKPSIGTQISYQGKFYNSMEELLEVLKKDPTVELLGFSCNLCGNNKITQMFPDDFSKQQGPHFASSDFQDLINCGNDNGMKSTLCLKSEILSDWKVCLTVFLENSMLNEGSDSIEGEFVAISKNRYTVAHMPVPDRFFTVIPGIVFPEDNESNLAEAKVSQEQQSIILVLKPVIFKE